MKTAIELADEFPEQNLANIEPDAANILNWWGIEAVAMLRQQAEQIEALTKMLVISDHTHQAWMKENSPGGWIDDLRKENESLKADAERYQWWVTQVELKDFENLEKAFKSMEVREDVTKQMMDAAIDAMKGAS